MAFSPARRMRTSEDREFIQHIGRQVAIATETPSPSGVNELRAHKDERSISKKDPRQYRFDEIVGSTLCAECSANRNRHAHRFFDPHPR
jgi:hypothetical protein